MKITKRGVKPSEKVWHGECRTCRSEAEASQSELTDIQHDDREGSSFCWMKCPVCESGPYGGMLFYPKKSDH